MKLKVLINTQVILCLCFFSFGQVPTSWKHSSGIFRKIDKNSTLGLPIWYENDGKFQYEEVSSSSSEVVLRDLNRPGVQIKLTSNGCYYKDNGRAEFGLIYNGSWEVNSLISNDAQAYYKSGLAKYELKDFTGAINEFSKAIQINPKFRDAYEWRGNSYRKLDKHQEYVNDFNKVIELNPNISTNDYLLIASSKLRIDDIEGALKIVDIVIKTYPNMWEGHYTKTRILYVKQDYVGCIQSANNVLRLSPSDGDAYFFKAMSEGYLGQVDNSCNSFNKAISLGNDFAKEIYFNNKINEMCSKLEQDSRIKEPMYNGNSNQSQIYSCNFNFSKPTLNINYLDNRVKCCYVDKNDNKCQNYSESWDLTNEIPRWETRDYLTEKLYEHLLKENALNDENHMFSDARKLEKYFQSLYPPDLKTVMVNDDYSSIIESIGLWKLFPPSKYGNSNRSREQFKINSKFCSKEHQNKCLESPNCKCN
jgi:tetratricopeptide (TPR) repeat protein